MKPSWVTEKVSLGGSTRLGLTKVSINFNSPKPPVVFFHGWGVEPHTYHTPLDALALDGFDIYAPHLPGFGYSTPLQASQAGNLSAYADRFAHGWDNLKLPQPVPILAHSMGTGVAIKLATMYPELVESLTLVCPIGGSVMNLASLQKLSSSFFRELRVEWASETFHVLPRMLMHPSIAARSAIIARTALLTKDLAQVAKQVPTSVIVADRDGIVPAGPLLDVPGINLTVVSGGHGWLIQNPELFVANVAPALQSWEDFQKSS